MALALWLVLLAVPSSACAARLALVVGIDSYEHIPRLRNARADAQTMAAALEAAGYNVVLRTDRRLRDLLGDLREFRARIRERDQVVFFFAGHGVQIGGMNHLLPADVGAKTEAEVRDESLTLSKVLDDLRGANPTFTLAIIDACRDNPFAVRGRSIGGRGLTGVAGATGQMVIYAAGEGQQALDRLGPGDTARNGLFTRVFVREMQVQGLSVDAVLKRVRREVNRLAQTVGHDQVPAIYDQVLGDFYFYPGVTTAPTTSPVPAPTPAHQAPATAPTAFAQARPFKDCDDCPLMVVVPPGRFARTAGQGGPGALEAFSVARSLAIGVYEVTFAEWDSCVAERACVASADEGWGRGSQPAINVSWNDAKTYVAWLSRKTGKSYRLPRDAEWEYVARAGSAESYPWGGDAGMNNANCLQCGAAGLAGRQPAAVGTFQHNSFGLHDVIGNVWEWVEDCASPTMRPLAEPATDVSGGCTNRLLRGGSFRTASREATLEQRRPADATTRSPQNGFRVARDP